MHSRIQLKFAIIVVGLLSLATLSRAQEASQKPASELYTKAVHGKKVAQPGRSVSSASAAKNLPSEQRNIVPQKLKTGQTVNSAQRRGSDEDGELNLRSNAKIPHQQPNRLRRMIKPSAPAAE